MAEGVGWGGVGVNGAGFIIGCRRCTWCYSVKDSRIGNGPKFIVKRMA